MTAPDHRLPAPFKRPLASTGASIHDHTAWIDGEIAPLYRDKGRPGIESRFVIGLLLLKHMFGLSDEGGY